MIEKSAWRYMQFSPELYPVSDYKFTPTSSLGIIAREYEVTQLVQLLQTMDKGSPMYGQLLEAIIDHMNLSNREELIQSLRQAAQPNPQAQQLQQQQAQMQMAQLQAQIAAFNGQAAEAQARAQKYQTETGLVEYEAQTDRIKALSTNLEPGIEDDKEFERRAKIAELILKEKELNQKAPTGVANANQQRMGQNIPTNRPEVRQTGGQDQSIGESLQQALQGGQGASR
jgi:uncharacterized protein with von Willebrand factor type A (vWA) domain